MKVLIASNNKNKLVEIKRILGDIYPNMLTPAELGLDLEVEEDGDTFLSNATKKAVAFMQASGMDALADDSGLCVDALGGLPGVHSARFARDNMETNIEIGGLEANETDHNDAANNAKLLRMLQGKEGRAAKFVSCVVLARTDGSIVHAHGESHGTILEHPRGSGGFGYDPLFYDEDLRKTYAELTMAQKNQVSHRAKALHNLYRALKQIS